MISYRQRHPGVDELEAAGITCLPADFGSEAGILAFIEQVQQHADGLRAIIHNASAWQADPVPANGSAFNTLFHVHMLAPYLINLACEPLLRQSPIADIIHISDDVTRRGSSHRVAYSASKAALDNMTLSFASQFAPHIKVNGISPALIMLHPDDGVEYARQAMDKSVLKTVPGPEVVMQAVEYLLNNPYVTGTTLCLNGGRHLKN
ncbi:dihydromonapterin reductase/dihydrofolate reductase [Thiopseudomonas denitrificans]|uniref:Dihydromonapterin reductase n=2 Tax=Thiopseudomonas denitrificans TaxID=1501432 RepID=A0A4R6U2F1_9GAMM|nr:dihydromonapterin reductase/dihydrofolate reductase [Thiopseudomonas denitrificans]